MAQQFWPCSITADFHGDNFAKFFRYFHFPPIAQRKDVNTPTAMFYFMFFASQVRLLRSLFARSLAAIERKKRDERTEKSSLENIPLSIRIQAVFRETSAKSFSPPPPNQPSFLTSSRTKTKRNKKWKQTRMSANISKWFPKAASQRNSDKVFGKTKTIERELKILANKFTTNINFNLLDYYVSCVRRRRRSRSFKWPSFDGMMFARSYGEGNCSESTLEILGKTQWKCEEISSTLESSWKAFKSFEWKALIEKL